jgi:UDP-N-acetylglucosamine acyltransferase
VAVHVHPSAVVGADVELADGVRIGPGAVVLGPARIGERVWIGPGAVVGTPPEITSIGQTAGWDGEPGQEGVVIGADTVVRELTSIHQGSATPTRIGAGCWILNRSYIAHDCQIGDSVTVSAGSSLGGFVHIGDGATLGMNVTVHQYRRVGDLAMIGMASAVTRDVPPYAKAFGVPASLRGLNAVGMRRSGFSDEEVAAVAAVYDGDGSVASLPPATRDVIDDWFTLGPARPMLARPD